MPLIKSVSGVRGIVDDSCGLEVTMTLDLAHDMGCAFATYLAREKKPQREGVRWLVGGRDGRPGGQGLFEAFAAGAWTCGARIVPLGVIPTPTVGLAVAEFSKPLAVCGGVVITASHNPQQWNGIKLLMVEGGRAPTAREAESIFTILDERAFNKTEESDLPRGDPSPDAGDIHVERVMQNTQVEPIRRREFRVALDSVNGAGARVGKLLLESLGCRVTPLNNQPDTGFDRNPEPTNENLSGFCAKVVEIDAEVGFAQDPDADRLAIVDETGRYVGEEYTLALAAKHIFKTNPGPAVANLSTSRMIDELAKQAGGACVVHRSAVGEANVVEVMQRVGAHIGGEGNGGVIDPRVVFIRDSIASMALVLELMAAEGKPLSQIVDDIPRFTIVKTKVEANQSQIAKALDDVRAAFAGQNMNDLDGVRIDWAEGWVHIRGSNTEPIMRIIAEAKDESTAVALIDRVRAVVDQAS